MFNDDMGKLKKKGTNEDPEFQIPDIFTLLQTFVICFFFTSRDAS